MSELNIIYKHQYNVNYIFSYSENEVKTKINILHTYYSKELVKENNSKKTFMNRNGHIQVTFFHP